jgi:hypothetical protein
VLVQLALMTLGMVAIREAQRSGSPHIVCVLVALEFLAAIVIGGWLHNRPWVRVLDAVRLLGSGLIAVILLGSTLSELLVVLAVLVNTALLPVLHGRQENARVWALARGQWAGGLGVEPAIRMFA